jgi:hypothetical protein
VTPHQQQQSRWDAEQALLVRVLDAYITFKGGKYPALIEESGVEAFANWLFHASSLSHGATPEGAVVAVELGSESDGTYAGTTQSFPVPGVGLMGMSLEARILLDLTLARYCTFAELDMDAILEAGVYSFAYWLFRHSGLVEPSEDGWAAIRGHEDWLTPEERRARREEIREAIRIILSTDEGGDE